MTVPASPAVPAAALALRRYAGHAASGDTRAALHAASDACHAAPDWPQAHYAYGEAWAALGEPARAEQAFAAAIRLRPGWAEAWVNLGLARYRQGATGDAITAMRQALRHAPGHTAATANLGAFLRITGAAEEGEALLRAAIAAAPYNAGARLNLAADLLQEERPADALALLDAAPARPDALPARRHWHLQRSLALVQLGRLAEARAELAALDAAGPLPAELAALRHWRHVLLAQGAGDRAGAVAQAEYAHRWTDREALLPPDLSAIMAAGGEITRHLETLPGYMAAVPERRSRSLPRRGGLSWRADRIPGCDRPRSNPGPADRNRLACSS